MKKVIKLSEKDLGHIIKRVLKEENNRKDISDSRVCLSVKDVEILFGMSKAYCMGKGEKYLERLCSNLDGISSQIDDVYSQNDLKRGGFEAMNYV